MAETMAWPLIGRDAEVRFATEVLARDELVVLAGDGGVGKTRLLAELARGAQDEGVEVVHVTGTRAARGIPLAAFAHVLPALTEDTARDEVLARIVAGLNEVGTRRLLVIDDAHLLDDASATLVGHLAARRTTAMAVAVRSGEPCPDPVVALWKDRGAVRLELQPVSELEAAQLLRAVLGAAVDRGTVRMLWSTTAGNVLYLREVVAEGLKQQVLRRDTAVWRWHGPPVVSPSLGEYIAGRMRGLGRDSLAALELVAVAEPIGAGVADRLVDPDLLDELEADGLVRFIDLGGRRVVRVGHPLYSESVRQSLSERRADRLRARVADAIEAEVPLGPDDRLRVASLRIEAGVTTTADLLVSAARRAWMLNDPGLVERLARAALDAGPNPEASFLIGETLADRGLHDEAVALWEEQLDGDCDDALRARMAMAAASTLARTSLDKDRARELLEAAEARVASVEARGHIAAFRTMLFVKGMSPAEVEEATGPLLEAPEVADEARVWAWLASARQRMIGGEVESVLAESDRMAELAGRSSEPLIALLVSMSQLFALLMVGRLDEAEALAAGGLEATLDDPLPFPRVHWVDALGLVAIARGHLDQAAGYLEEAVDVLRENNNGVLHGYLLELAWVRANQGDAVAADAAVQESIASDQSVIGTSVTTQRAQAAVLAARGDLEGARRRLLDWVDDHVDDPQPYHAGPTWHDVARYGHAAEAAPELAALCARYDGPVVVAWADQARALAGDDAQGLVDVAARFALLGLDLDAAESEAAATRLLRGSGRRSSAAAAAGRAKASLEACGRARTPLLAGLQDAVALTHREQQVADLVAGGLSDAAVAERLGISLRTVHAHLRSVFSKLGVARRQDLADALGVR